MIDFPPIVPSRKYRSTQKKTPTIPIAKGTQNPPASTRRSEGNANANALARMKTTPDPTFENAEKPTKEKSTTKAIGLDQKGVDLSKEDKVKWRKRGYTVRREEKHETKQKELSRTATTKPFPHPSYV